jgi:hypothetical protein
MATIRGTRDDDPIDDERDEETCPDESPDETRIYSGLGRSLREWVPGRPVRGRMMRSRVCKAVEE